MRPSDQVRALAADRGLLRARDLAPLGVPRATLRRMLQSGDLIRLARGVYCLPGRKTSGFQSLAEVAVRCPAGVFCLLTALQFHRLTTQSPHEVWLAVPNNARAPRLDYPPLKIARFSGDAFSHGVEDHVVDGVRVRVYSVAKTIADCFKYRNKIGLDVALEALRECRREKRASMDALWASAKVCRVAAVMRPYLEGVE